jgi:hypothetical protein
MKKYLFFLLLLFLYATASFSNIHYKHISHNKIAQTLFDEGMLNYDAYLYAQAEYNFRQALIYDPKCSMCYWGLALAKKQQALELGRPFAQVGFEDIQNAAAQDNSQNEFYKDVIQAAMHSFSLGPTISSKELQIHYINSLRNLYLKYKNNKEWATESLFLLVDAIAYFPNVDNSSSTTLNHCSLPLKEDYKKEALTLMQPILKDPSYVDHPGLLHTYIHLAERNLTDPLAEMAANKLSSFSKGKIAHFTHMPNHIYWRRGMYDKAIKANLDAIKIDLNYFKHNGAGLNSYYYEYHYLHSHHFLSVLGVLTNNFDLSVKYARMIKNLMDINRMSELKNDRDTFLSLEHLVLARFKKWDAVLKLEVPAQTQELGLLFINFSKALAYLNLGQKEEYQKLVDRIKNKKYEQNNLIEFQILITSYLKASQIGLEQKTSLADIEKIFIENQVNKIEEKLFSSNPPIWFFPHYLLLSDIAAKKSDFNAAKKYHGLYLTKYPKSTLGNLD